MDDKLKEFRLPVLGMKKDRYHFDFQIDKEFFKILNEDDIGIEVFDVSLDFIRKSGSIFLQFDVNGNYYYSCDRCLEAILIPKSFVFEQIVKITKTPPRNEDDEFVYIRPEDPILDLAPIIREMMYLNIPMIKTKDCESEGYKDCNESILKKLNPEEEANEQKSETNPLWDDLKNITFE